MEQKRISASQQVGSAGVFSPEVDGKSLKFRHKDGKILDKDTGSTWNILGMATGGPLVGKRLKPIKHGVFYAFAWMSFMPQTDLIGAAPPQDLSGGFPGRPGGVGGAPGVGSRRGASELP